MFRFFKRAGRKLFAIFYRKITFSLSKKNRFLSRSLVQLKRARLIVTDEPELYSDYIRLATLELCAYEIKSKGLKGSVAELGVFQGDFAQKINEAFPDIKLYLFDTFEGFNKEDASFDMENKYSAGDKHFSDTSAELVLSRMKYPQNCIIKKGKFPETARGVEDRFVFVSIDVDLFKPTYEGLKFFYPRLEDGGYIFIDDFNNVDWRGVKEAVVEFCLENKISYTPIPDAHGSIIITK